MNTQPSDSLISGSDCPSGSVPNLPSYEKDAYVNTASRKRKEQADTRDHGDDFASFRADIMHFLQEFGKTQNEKLTHIREEIQEIKSEVKTIKLSTEIISQKFTKINDEIEKIKSNNTITEVKMNSIIKEISHIQEKQSSSKSPFDVHENLIRELKDRCDREKNIVIVGILEKNDKNSNSRRNHDEIEIMKVIKSLYEDCPKPIKIMRLGKYIPNKSRPLKVCFDNINSPKNLLRNKAKLTHPITIYSDQTPTQKQYLQSLKEELNKRMQNGEQNLVIKYIKGMPTITSCEINQKNQ